MNAGHTCLFNKWFCTVYFGAKEDNAVTLPHSAVREDTDKFIEVADGHHVTSKHKGSVSIQMCDYNGKTFVATLYNVLLPPDLCDRLFFIITFMNAEHTCLFHKGFCTVYFGAKEDNTMTLPHSAVRKHAFSGKVKDVPKKIQQERKLF